jgi:uncharacterized protein (TIGR00255 family)
MSAIRSMTGFAASEGSFADGTVFTLTLKSVNHRFLDVNFRLPSGCDALEAELRRILKEHTERGHVEVTLELGRTSASGHRINDDVLDGLVASLRAAAERLGLTQEPELSSLLRMPGVMMSDARGHRPAPEEMASAVMPVMLLAVDRLNAFREREGAALDAELRAGMMRLRAASEAIGGLRAGVRQGQFLRLRAKLQELLEGSSVSEERLLTEAALLADKSDVEEEAVRLRTHIDRFLGILNVGGAVGKRLDFLLQELSREANTTLAKTGSAAGPDGLQITKLGLEMKSEIERAREQVQNLE